MSKRSVSVSVSAVEDASGRQKENEKTAPKRNKQWGALRFAFFTSCALVSFLLVLDGALARLYFERPGCGPRPGEDIVLVISDLHIDPLCPFADPWMRFMVDGARHRWNVLDTIVLGDLSSWGGYDGGNVSAIGWSALLRRVMMVTGCAQYRCIVLPGNHDLGDEPTERWLTAFGPNDRSGQSDFIHANGFDMDGC